MNTPVKIRLLLALAVALATVTTFLLLADKSFWLDEVFSIEAARDWSTMWDTNLKEGGNMWFYFLLLHWWLKIGDSEFVVRSLSAIFAVATVPTLYLLGARLFEPRVGLVAALALSVNPFFIHYAQEARSYSLVTLLATVSFYFFARLVERPSLRYSAGHVVFSTLAVWTHYFGLLVLVSQAVSVVFHRQSQVPWKWLTANGTIIMFLFAFSAAPFLIALSQLPTGTMGHLAWIPRPHLGDIYRLFLSFSGGWPLLLIYFVLSLFALAGPIARLKGAGLTLDTWRYAYLVTWVWVPIAASYAFSVLIQPVFWPRFLIICIPGLILLVGAGLSNIGRRWLFATTFVVLFVLSGRSAWSWYTGAEKENWRAAAAFVATQAQAGDALMFLPYYIVSPFNYYLERSGTSPALFSRVELDFNEGKRQLSDSTRRLLGRLSAKYPRLWLVLSPHRPTGLSTGGGTESETDQLIQRALNRHYEVFEERRFKGQDKIHVLLYQRRRAEPIEPN